MESSAFRPSPDASCTPGRMFVCQMGQEIRVKTNIFHHHFVEEQKVWSFFSLDTLLKTNIAPENGLMVDYFHFGEKGLFWGAKIWVFGRARWKIQTKLASHLDFVVDGCLAKVGKRPWKGHGIIMHTTDNAGHRGPFCLWCHYLLYKQLLYTHIDFQRPQNFWGGY